MTPDPRVLIPLHERGNFTHAEVATIAVERGQLAEENDRLRDLLSQVPQWLARGIREGAYLQCVAPDGAQRLMDAIEIALTPTEAR